MTKITIEPLTKEAFLPFGDVIEIQTSGNHHPINGGTTERFHDLSTVVATGENARPILSMARAAPFTLPHEIDMVERHPYGSQCFMPIVPTRFLVVVAKAENGVPGTPRAFLSAPGQGVNYFAGTWHGPLCAIDHQTDFIIIDREGSEPNCDEHFYETPFIATE